MPGFHVYTGNRTETLVARLAETLREPLEHPLAPEVIVVQSRGMERWVAMELARLNGICANTRFPFPNAFLDEIFGGFPEEEGGLDDAFSADAAPFRIMQLLPEALDHPDFRPLRDYLADDPGSSSATSSAAVWPGSTTSTRSSGRTCFWTGTAAG